MELQNVIENCRTFHSFTNEKIKIELIEKALSNALLAPNHKFTFPWKFYWLGENKKNELAKINLDLKMQKLDAMSVESQQDMINKIIFPEVILFAQKKNEDAFTQKEDYATLSCSIQLFALTLASYGIGYKWSTGKVIRDQRTYDLLGIDPVKEEIIGLIMAGVSAKKAGNRTRPPLNDVLVRCH